ncbi:MAG: hypothetical protein PHR39_04700 [Actinomycetota bacterium]|nr:hypothetical protein [Actinomycetota bacterium]
MFGGFTKKYEISKTLRFELKPVRETKILMEENKVIEKDKLILDNYHEVKKYFDKYHQFFIEESLKLSNINFNDFFNDYKRYKNNKKENIIHAKKDFVKIKNIYRKKICMLFDKKAKELSKLYKQNLNIDIEEDKSFLKKKKIFLILKDHFRNEEKEDIFSLFNGFTTYFSGYYLNRDNFYKDNGISSAIATRIIDENLIKFLDNIELYHSYKNILNLSKEELDCFEISNYNKALLQKDINIYNFKIGEINKKINLYNQGIDNSLGGKKPKIRFFKKLYTQILGKDQAEENKYIEIKTNKEVFGVLKDLDVYNVSNIKNIEIILDLLFNQEINNENNNLDIKNIFIAKRFLNTISGK